MGCPYFRLVSSTMPVDDSVDQGSHRPDPVLLGSDDQQGKEGRLHGRVHSRLPRSARSAAVRDATSGQLPLQYVADTASERWTDPHNVGQCPAEPRVSPSGSRRRPRCAEGSRYGCHAVQVVRRGLCSERLRGFIRPTRQRVPQTAPTPARPRPIGGRRRSVKSAYKRQRPSLLTNVVVPDGDRRGCA